MLGFSLLLAHALWRLTPLALEPIQAGTLTWGQATAYVIWVLWMAYSEGYKGFHQQVSPRVVVRAMYLARHPRPLHVLLAPVFCMALIHATRRRLIVSWCVLLGVVGLVVAVGRLEQPWRGIIDGGVVVGLAWGLLMILVHFARALAGKPVPVSSELPGGA